MSPDEIQSFFKRLPNLNVVVVGDVMVDGYAWGRSDRMSPEAPVPVLQIQSTEYRLGGAANVALNLKAMGVKTALLSVCGEDEAGAQLKTALLEADLSTDGLISVPHRPTTLKTRIMNGAQQLLRIDEEMLEDLDEDSSSRLMQALEEALKGAHALILQDYDKGVLSRPNIQKILEMAKKMQVPVAVDPKKLHFFDYEGVALFKPNLKELAEALEVPLSKSELNAVRLAAEGLRSKLQAQAVLLTLSEAGVMFLGEGDKGQIPAHPRNIVDVSGAGDTVIAVAGCCLAAGLPLKDLAALSNLAGGLVCESLGVVPIKSDKLLREALLTAE